jgi:hypothetical protein
VTLNNLSPVQMLDDFHSAGAVAVLGAVVGWPSAWTLKHAAPSNTTRNIESAMRISKFLTIENIAGHHQPATRYSRLFWFLGIIISLRPSSMYLLVLVVSIVGQPACRRPTAPLVVLAGGVSYPDQACTCSCWWSPVWGIQDAFCVLPAGGTEGPLTEEPSTWMALGSANSDFILLKHDGGDGSTIRQLPNRVSPARRVREPQVTVPG